MKKILVLLVLVGLSISSYSQSSRSQEFKFKSNAVSVSRINSDSVSWSKFSEYKVIDVLVSIDSKCISIYEPTVREYKIVKFLSNFNDGFGSRTISWRCIDVDGVKCDISVIMKLAKGGKNIQMYIDYKYVSLVYNLIKI